MPRVNINNNHNNKKSMKDHTFSLSIITLLLFVIAAHFVGLKTVFTVLVVGVALVVLLALLAVVVWQINTPVLVLVIAFLAAVAANEIMRCAKVENTFIRVVATGYAACVPFFASAKALTPWVSQAVCGSRRCVSDRAGAGVTVGYA